ncbi:MAG: YbaK/EbsC family protein [Eubacteriales bacterium]|nr:YbaK/EbsC family protein [Eubacteriales bacterium]MDD3882818.1 YbaK/EbsC family protein [Eubacteriales bacterium]MDD4513284.1 YbaK/EbsC family protein [Eubacteriales bacterium]
MPEVAQEIVTALEKEGIPYRLLSHSRFRTMEECRLIQGIDTENTALFKNVFLCNRQKSAFYLLLLSAEKRFVTSQVSKALLSSRLSFGSEEDLLRLLNATSGSVSPAGLLFDTECAVRLAVDEDIAAKPFLAFHPNDCSKTVVMARDDFFGRFLPLTHHSPVLLSLPAIAENAAV